MSTDADTLREALAEDGWVPGSVAMNALDRLAAAEAREIDYAGYGEILESLTARAEAAEDRLRACEAANQHLRAEIERLAAALRGIARTTAWEGPDGTHASWLHWAAQANAALAAVTPAEAAG